MSSWINCASWYNDISDEKTQLNADNNVKSINVKFAIGSSIACKLTRITENRNNTADFLWANLFKYASYSKRYYKF
jgi:hypothetical protein